MNEEEVKETLKTMKENIDKKYLKTRNSVAIETVLNILEKKDKIIDLMAKTINEAFFASGDFEVWFEDEICKVQRYEDYTYVEKDIKQYFERGTK